MSDRIRTIFASGVAAAFVIAVASGGAAAQSGGSTASPPILYADGPVVIERWGDALAAKRSVAGALVEVGRASIAGTPFSDRSIVDLQCAISAPVCYIGVRAADAQDPDWLRFDLERGVLDPIADLQGVFIQDVRADGAQLLFTRRADSGPTGLFMREADGSSRLISSGTLRNQPDIAAYLTGSGDSPIVSLETAGPAEWVTRRQSGEIVARRPALSRTFQLSQAGLISVVAASAAAADRPMGSLVLLDPSVPNGRQTRLYGGEPPVEEAGPELPAGVTLHPLRGALLAVVRSDQGVQLGELCGAPGVVTFRPLPAFASGYGRFRLEGGADFALITATDLWGRIGQARIDAPGGATAPLRACDAPAFTTQDLKEGPGSSLKIISAEVERSGYDVRYVILGADPAQGPLLVRPYGAADLPTAEYVATPVERAWVEAGGRILVPTLTGDAGAPPTPRPGDHKAQATADLLAALDDAVARGWATPGEIELMGTSAGAFVAARAAVTRPDLFRSVVLMSGALDLSLLARQPVLAAEFGPAEGGFATWYQGRPAPERAPLFLLYHATDDVRVPTASATNFAQYLKSLGYRGELVESDRGGHQVGLLTDTAPRVMTFLNRDAAL